MQANRTGGPVPTSPRCRHVVCAVVREQPERRRPTAVCISLVGRWGGWLGEANASSAALPASTGRRGGPVSRRLGQSLGLARPRGGVWGLGVLNPLLGVRGCTLAGSSRHCTPVSGSRGTRNGPASHRSADQQMEPSADSPREFASRQLSALRWPDPVGLASHTNHMRVSRGVARSRGRSRHTNAPAIPAPRRPAAPLKPLSDSL